jgi:Rod binding domain-containing protein
MNINEISGAISSVQGGALKTKQSEMVAREFDTIFYSTLLRSTNWTKVLGGKKSAEGSLVSGLFNDQFAAELASKHQTGLGKMLLAAMQKNGEIK